MSQSNLIHTISRKIAKNTVSLFIGVILEKICLLALLVVAARYLGPEGFGKYVFAVSFTLIFLTISDCGSTTIAIRETAKDKSLTGRYIGNTMVLRGLLAFIAAGAIILFVYLLNLPRQTANIVYIIGFSAVFISFSQGLRWCFQASEKMEYEAMLKILNGSLLLCAGALMLLKGKGLMGLAFAHVLTGIVVFVVSYIIVLKKFVKPVVRFDFGIWRYLLTAGFPIGVTSVFCIIYGNADTVMLSLMKGDTATAYYNAGHKINEAIKIMPSIFTVATFPVLAGLFSNSTAAMAKAFTKMVDYMIMIALPIAIGITILSPKIISLFWGDGYSEAVSTLQILIWGGALAFLSGIAGSCLNAMNKQKLPMYICGGGLCVNIILNLILIPRFSYAGAAISIVIAEFVITVSALYFVYKYLETGIFSPKIRGILAASVVMALLLWFIKDYNIVFVVAVAAAAYSGLLVIGRTITLKGIRLLTG